MKKNPFPICWLLMTEWSPDEGVGEWGGVGWGLGAAVKPHELQRSLVIYDGRVGLCSDLILPSLLHRTTHNVKQERGLNDLRFRTVKTFQSILCQLENTPSMIKNYLCAVPLRNKAPGNKSVRVGNKSFRHTLEI